ncbi:type II toxin-antitoxin system death-on-curing family toxin [Cytobacillus oceanisediminis]|jgi:death on curing protein|uniref:type II toxin-antitoxin system death-on-curing family toxin n=1 Tax=Cytobacillus oceanisediminis TaxID=665099 RepID=UPI001C23B76D|nr:type II toxin-antitoxin system death-on-curing family toxin [Cytobacillus oceanisediminis]MBU8772158.1 type II toxin-antitoxin system death-on-curing family toxin [Cytobacillus oceanisediminis]
MIHLSPEIAIEINKRMIEKYSKGELVGVKEPNLLDSAIHRPLQTMYGESLYQDIFEKAIALFESLAKNHVFHNANKRTAFACMAYFLFINGHICVMNEEKAADLTVGFVIGDYSFEEVVAIIKSHSYRKSIQS